MNNELTEEKLTEIVNIGNPKTININGERRYLSKDIIKQLKQGEAKHKEGGIFPLIPILAGIFGATAAAAGTASGIASTVANSRDAQKKKLEMEILENRKLGKGLYFDPYFGKGLKDSILNSNEYKTTLEKPDRTQLKELLKKMSKNKIKITSQGNGLFLEPFEHNG